MNRKLFTSVVQYDESIGLESSSQYWPSIKAPYHTGLIIHIFVRRVITLSWNIEVWGFRLSFTFSFTGLKVQIVIYRFEGWDCHLHCHSQVWGFRLSLKLSYIHDRNNNGLKWSVRNDGVSYLQQGSILLIDVDESNCDLLR